MDINNIGKTIKKLRELRNYTQEYMAEQLSMSQTGYSKIERNETDISISKIQEIAKVLNITFEDILGFDEKLNFFNNITNNEQSVQTILYSNTFDRERKLYEERIQAQEKEILFLRGLLGK